MTEHHVAVNLNLNSIQNVNYQLIINYRLIKNAIKF